MRIAHIIGRMDAAGVENVVFNYFRHVNRGNVSFDIFYNADSSVAPPTEIVKAGAKFHCVRPYRRLHAYLFDLWRLLDRREYDIVHAHVNTLSVLPLCVARLKGIPVRIAHSHSTTAPGERARNLAKYLLRCLAKLFPTHLMACSRNAGEWLFGKRAMDDGRVVLLKNAILLEGFSYDPEKRAAIRKVFGIGDGFLIGHVGRFVFAKNHAFLLDVFARLKGAIPDARLILVGSGPLRKAVEAQAERLGLAGDVLFAGTTDDVSKYYQAMDCFAFPSRYEGLPLTVVEAQAAGLPVVASDRVPEEALFTPCSKRLSLDAGAQYWAEQIAETRRQWPRRNREEGALLAERAGYSIQSEAKKLEAFYASCARERALYG